jgi:hypothetical protein
MSQFQIETLASVLERSLQLTLREASLVREQDRFLQVKPGKGHPMWLLGHLASSCDMAGAHWILGLPNQIDGAFRKKFAPDFMQGDPITTNPADYPDWAEVTAVYERAVRRFIDSLKSLTDEDLPGPTRGDLPERLKEKVPNLLMGATMMILHDSHHRGQMAMISHLNQ